uniref:Uncharacterized protein n=1 Tax=Mandrillus leucophaeus TaxID=9568 RepID=A0A2K5ZHC3_MANLE
MNLSWQQSARLGEFLQQCSVVRMEGRKAWKRMRTETRSRGGVERTGSQDHGVLARASHSQAGTILRGKCPSSH